MLPEGLILDHDLAPFGISIISATLQRQNYLWRSINVFNLILKTIMIPSLMTRMLEQSAQVRFVCLGKGSPAGKTSVSFPE